MGSCLHASRARDGGWVDCGKRTHWAMCDERIKGKAGWAYELRYCSEHYERVIGVPAPPAIRRGDAPNYRVLEIRRAAQSSQVRGGARGGAVPVADVSKTCAVVAGQRPQDLPPQVDERLKRAGQRRRKNRERMRQRVGV